MRKVPKLRFKEFSNEWEEKKLGEISEVIKQKADEINDFPILTISAGKGFINQEDRFSKIIAGKSLEKYTLLKKNEFSYNRGNSKQYKYGCIYKLNNYEIALVPNVYRSFKLNKENPEFYFQLFQKKYLDNQLKKIISSSARMDGLLNISEKDFFDVKVPLTLLKEQEKIASFLTNVDKKISLTEEKLELFREYKKGVMQKIFSQELRFKDSNGNDYPEWEEKTLGNYINFLTGYPFNSKKFNEEKRGVPLIRIRNLLDSNISTYYEGEYENKYIIKREDILIGMDGDFNVVKWKNNGALLNQRIVKVFSKNNLELCNTFLYYILEKPIKNINLKTFSTTVKHLSVKDIEKIIVNLPILKEQEKIANFLSDIDNKIENIEKELEGLKEFKKGLLQQMFV